MLYCLIVTGFPLDTGTCQALYEGARKLYASGSEKVKLKGDAFEGRLTSKRRDSVLGGIAGALFEAILETDIGTTKAEFIIPIGELPSKKATWTMTTPNGETFDIGAATDLMN